MTRNYGEIISITRPIRNGMYTDKYTVRYQNGWKDYTINGAMIKKHFEFIMKAKVERKYSNVTGRHTADIFTA